MIAPTHSRRRSGRTMALAARAIALAAAWWAIAEGDLRSFAVGAPVIALALPLSVGLLPPGRARPRPFGAARLIGFFLVESVRGGIDVARRAIDPRMPLSPALIEYTSTLTGGARRLFGYAATLMPGTLCVEDRGGSFLVHVVDRHGAAREHLFALERRIAAALTAAEAVPHG